MNPTQPQLTERLALCKQVARLARARLPISGELSKQMQSSKKLRQSASALDEQLQSGKSLTQALAGDNSRDSRILSACIQAGEISGRLDRTLEAWTSMHMANSRSAKSLRAAMLYPLMLIAVTVGSLGYVTYYLIPEYKKTYELFGRNIPLWLDLITRVREQFWWLVIVLAVLAVAPLVIWAIRRRMFDSMGLPVDRASRLRLQGLASELASHMIDSSTPLMKVVHLSVAATGADENRSSTAFEKIQNRAMIEPLGRESSLLLALLHTGVMDRTEASQNLVALGQHLQQQADQVAQRQVRWLPMMIALVVGVLTILTYLFLIYLPWLLLLKQIIQAPSQDH
jgi:type II secretory pathway component PulF